MEKELMKHFGNVCWKLYFVWRETGFEELKTLDGSSSNTRLTHLMTCISITYDEKFNLCTCFLSVSLCSFSVFWKPQNAISSQHIIRKQIVCSKRIGYICFGIRNIN